MKSRKPHNHPKSEDGATTALNLSWHLRTPATQTALSPQPAHGRAKLRFLLFFLLVAGLFIAAILALDDEDISVQAVRTAIDHFGPWAPAAYIGLMAIRPFSFFPSHILFAARGLAFGSLLGTAYSIVGYALGALTGFVLARALGRDFVEGQVDRSMAGFGFRSISPSSVLMLNIVPLVPNAPVNFASGLSRMSVPAFALATILGIAPHAASCCYLGDVFGSYDPTKLGVAIAIVVLVTFAPLAFYLKGLPYWKGS